MTWRRRGRAGPKRKSFAASARHRAQQIRHLSSTGRGTGGTLDEALDLYCARCVPFLSLITRNTILYDIMRYVICCAMICIAVSSVSESESALLADVRRQTLERFPLASRMLCSHTQGRCVPICVICMDN